MGWIEFICKVDPATISDSQRQLALAELGTIEAELVVLKARINVHIAERNIAREKVDRLQTEVADLQDKLLTRKAKRKKRRGQKLKELATKAGTPPSSVLALSGFIGCCAGNADQRACTPDCSKKR